MNQKYIKLLFVSCILFNAVILLYNCGNVRTISDYKMERRSERGENDGDKSTELVMKRILALLDRLEHLITKVAVTLSTTSSVARATKTPIKETPTTETPTKETPTTESPTIETPAIETPTKETPTIETPTTKTPTTTTKAPTTTKTPTTKTPTTTTKAPTTTTKAPTTTTKTPTTTTKTPTTKTPTTTTETPSTAAPTPTEKLACVPQKNMVYLKTHKTASTAVQNVILRRAFKEKLRVLQPPNQHDFNYPGTFSCHGVKYCGPLRLRVPNILCHHARLDYKKMSAVMPDNSVWVTSVREPLALYTSSIVYFRPIVPAFQRIQPDDPVELWFDHAENFTKTSKRSPYDRLTRNHMLFDLGFDWRHSQDVKYVQYAIEQLDKIFDLVLVADHFDESMVLLSDLLCWPIQDFACLTLNARKKDSKKISEEAEERTRRKVRDWNKGDSMVFDHFNASLWRKIEEYGMDRMEKQLLILRNEKERLKNSCLAKTDPVELSQLSIKEKRKHYQPKGMTKYQLKEDAGAVCKHLVKEENSLSREFFKFQSTWR